jgi:hypothetical protein
MERTKCVECNKTLRCYTRGDPKVHRKCWLKIRDKNERHLDFLFCKDKSKREMKKMKIVHPDKLQPTPLKQDDILPPILEESVQILDIKGNLLTIPKQFIIEKSVLGFDDATSEEDKILNQIMDIAGNIYTLNDDIISSSLPPSPPASPASTDFQ